MLLFGDPKVGKSFAALQLACCLVSGSEWLGFRVPQAVKVVYIQLDTPRALWADRVESLGSSGHPVDAVYFADRETLDTHPFNILNPEHFRMLSTALTAISPGVVIIDTLRESHNGDENDSTDMQNVTAHLEAAVKPAALILISHARKSNPEQDYNLMNDNRGSNYIVGKMDAICRFSHTSLRVSSRTQEEHSIKLDRDDDGTWNLGKDPSHDVALMLVTAHPGAPVRELARMLHERCGEKSETACRAILRRLKPVDSGRPPVL